MKRITILFTIISFALFAHAQNADTVAAEKKRTKFIIGATYNSTLHYYGRTDSLQSSGLYPFAGIVLKNGLYATATVVFVHNKISTDYAATIAEAGYQFINKKENWSGNIFINRFFYQQDISLIQSAVKGSAGLNMSHTTKLVNINAGADLKWSESIDYSAYAGIDHAWRFEKIGKGVIVLDPSAYFYAGTQNFTRTYYEKKQFLFLPATEQAVTKTTKRFDILSYEVSCPVIYAINKLNLIVTPAYVIPQNVIDANGEQITNARSLFYATATIKVNL